MPERSHVVTTKQLFALAIATAALGWIGNGLADGYIGRLVDRAKAEAAAKPAPSPIRAVTVTRNGVETIASIRASTAQGVRTCTLRIRNITREWSLAC